MGKEFIAENGQLINDDVLGQWEAEYASEDWSGMEFGKLLHGLPSVALSETLSCKVTGGIKNAVMNKAREEQISISEFVKRAIVSELLRSA